MSLFQTSVLKKHIKGLDKSAVDEAWVRYSNHFHDKAIQLNIRNSKEEQYQEGFLRDLFVSVFGYVLNPATDFNLTTELKNVKGAKKTDGAILKDDKALAVIELKGTNTTDLTKVESQAFGYKNNQPGCVYVITSNFEKLRFYIDNAVDFEEFNLFQLTRERFEVLWLCLSSEYLLKNIPKQIKDESLTQEENITKKLYKDYSLFRNEIFDSIQRNNSDYDKLTLFKKTQKLLDRFLFIFFAEDRLLLPPNSIREIINQWTDLRDKYDEYQPLYSRFKKYFGYMNTGYKGKKHDIFAYNGGLFAPDDILDNIRIDDDLLYKHTQNLSNYDFESEVSVNILGHIFEHSLNEIEEIQAELEGVETDRGKSKRKRDGVFYTPKYITKYIVDNTVGKLCEEKKADLEIEEAEYEKGRKGRKKAILKTLVQKLEDYRNWLLGLTICDPACGSGAFLNQTLEFLISEHSYIDELNAKLLGEAMVLSEVENSILENNLFGVDLNEESVEIAKLSLWLRTAQKGRKLTSLNNNIKCGNSLIDAPELGKDKAFNWEKEFPDVFKNGGFDVIVGNPPYVVYIKSIFGEATLDYVNDKFDYAEYNPNTYALFTDLALNRLLRKSGYLGFIIPNSWLDGQYFSRMRKSIYQNKVNEIVYLKDTAFAEVVETVILNVRNRKAEGYQLKLTNDILNDDSFFEDIDFNKYVAGYNPFITSNNPLLLKLEEKFEKIKDHAIVYRGLETRNNKIWITNNKASENHIPILLGKDVNRYNIDFSGSYVNFIQNEMKSNANPDMYSQHKILMRRTGSSIIAAKDEDNMMVLKNSYLIIPDSEAKIDSLLAQLNSKLFAFFHKSKTSAENKAFAQFKGVYVLSFPFCFDENNDFSDLVKSRIATEAQLVKTKKSFLKYVKGNYSLEKTTRAFENWFLLDFAGFIKELKNAIKSTNKIRSKGGLQEIHTLTKKDEFDWLELFEENKLSAQKLYNQIEKLEKDIDQMVYELYDLTKEEIKMVEEATE
jgi:hypothetical protein